MKTLDFQAFLILHRPDAAKEGIQNGYTRIVASLQNYISYSILCWWGLSRMPSKKCYAFGGSRGGGYILFAGQVYMYD